MFVAFEFREGGCNQRKAKFFGCHWSVVSDTRLSQEDGGFLACYSVQWTAVIPQNDTLVVELTFQETEKTDLTAN